MNPNWRSFLESTEAVFKDDSDEILNFGDANGELQAAGSRTILVPLTHLGLIEASGDDAKAFLHSQFTSDINHLGAEQVQHSAWCTAKGRMQASFLAWREGEDFQLVVSGDLEAAVLKRLQMFVLRSKVSLRTSTASRLLLGLAGPQAAEALGDAGEGAVGARTGGGENDRGAGGLGDGLGRGGVGRVAGLRELGAGDAEDARGAAGGDGVGCGLDVGADQAGDELGARERGGEGLCGGKGFERGLGEGAVGFGEGEKEDGFHGGGGANAAS